MQTVEKFLLASLKTPSKHRFLGLAKDRGTINVMEWTEDCVHLNYDGAPTDGSAWIEGGNCKDRILRGSSSWALSLDDVRSAVRAWATTDHRSNQLGFRVGRMLSTGVGAIAVAPGVR